MTEVSVSVAVVNLRGTNDVAPCFPALSAHQLQMVTGPARLHLPCNAILRPVKWHGCSQNRARVPSSSAITTLSHTAEQLVATLNLGYTQPGGIRLQATIPFKGVSHAC